MSNGCLFTKENQKEQKQMQKKLTAGEITEEKYQSFLSLSIIQAKQAWINHSIRLRRKTK